jgi:hypothetical protein
MELPYTGWIVTWMRIKIILHGFDLIKHLVDDGTNPIFSHEYIVEDSAQQSPAGISTVGLGYQLV